MNILKSIVRGLTPQFLADLNRRRKILSSVTKRPWMEACSSQKYIAYDRSRFSILPPAFKRSPSFVIDVGANEGQWTHALTQLLSIPEIWVFEPNPEAMKVCRQRLGELSGITYFDVALGDEAGQVEFHVTAASDFSSVLHPRSEFLQAQYGAAAARVARTIPVKQCTLDSLVPESRSIDLLKIDVQGFERAVLAGARSVLARTRTVLIEANLVSHYASDDTFPALWNELADLGFSFWSLSAPCLGRDGRALWADAVFVRSEYPEPPS